MYEFINLNLLAIASLFISLTTLYLYLTRNNNYFTSLGIDGPKPIVFFGCFHKTITLTLNQIVGEDYKKYGRIYGWFFGTRPVLMINELQLIKDICIKDFHKFVDRNDVMTGDPFDDRQLTNTFGDEWKQLRSVISPTFTSGKMRKMYPLIEDCVKSLENVLMNAANTKQEVELRKLMGNLTMDVIARCAFATKIDTYNDTNNQFIKYAQKAFRGSWRSMLSFIILFAFPKYAKKLKVSFIDTDVKQFFTQAIKSIMKNRRNSKEKHIDFLQLMINVQNKENIVENDDKNSDTNGSIYESSGNFLQIDKTQSKLEISDMDIIASAFVFFAAGYETTATLLSFLSYMLVLHEDCQQKLYEELISAEKLDYETIARLPYLDACIAETQRLFSFAFTTRIAAEDYKLGDMGITIPKGMLININIVGIHHDPEYYPNPNRFDPERFMPENRHKLIPYSFLPFGIGPRNCVGMRFAVMEVKTAIAHIITKFKFVRTANTDVPLEFKKLSFLLIPKNGIKVGVEIRNA